MSSVTNIILSLEVLTDPLVMATFNKYLMHTYSNTLDQVDQYAGGNKEMEVDIWMGAFNYLDVSEFVTQVTICLAGLDATLLVQAQESDHFTVTRLHA